MFWSAEKPVCFCCRSRNLLQCYAYVHLFVAVAMVRSIMSASRKTCWRASLLCIHRRYNVCVADASFAHLLVSLQLVGQIAFSAD